MAQKKLIFIAGSPSATSRSWRLLQGIEQRVQQASVATRLYSIRDFDAERLLQADAADPRLRDYIENVRTSDGIVVGTPVYKATLSGALKILLDIIPPDALVNKVATGLATARIGSHLEHTGRALTSIFDFFRVGRQPPALLLVDEAVFADATQTQFSTDTERALDIAATQIAEALKHDSRQ